MTKEFLLQKLQKTFSKVKGYLSSHCWIHDLIFALLLAFLFTLFASTALSPLYTAYSSDSINLDSNYFVYEAWLWLNGKIPYLDFYDHKGLWHLSINALGIWLGGRNGIYALEVIFDWASFFFLFRSVRLLSGDSFGHRLFAGLGFGALLLSVGGGNSEAEWVLPFSTLAYCFYIKALVKEREEDFLIGNFFAGLEIGLALNCRPSDAMMGAALILFFMVRFFAKKRDKSWFFNSMFAILGLLIPCLVYSLSAEMNGYLDAMIKAVFIDNFSYLSRANDEWRAANQAASISMAIIGMLLAYYEWKKGRFPEVAFLFGFSSLFLGIIFFIIARYTTYYWTAFTFIILHLSYAISLMKPYKHLKWERPAIALLMVGILAYTISLVALYSTSGVLGFSYADTLSLQEAVDEIPDSIRTKEGAVFALDCDAAVYLDGKIVTNFPYSVNQSWWSQSNSKVLTATKKYLASENRPTYLLISFKDETMVNFGEEIMAYYENTAFPTNSYFMIYRAKLS